MRKQAIQLGIYLVAILSCIFLIVTKVSIVIPAGVTLVCGVQVCKVLKRTAALLLSTRAKRQGSVEGLLRSQFGAGVTAESLGGKVV